MSGRREVWNQWDDGRVWFGVYLGRSVLLTSLGVASLFIGAPLVSAFIFGVVVPYNLVVQRSHLRRGRAHPLLPADQVLAAFCTVLAPQVAVGSVICMVACGTDAMGVSARRVQAFGAAGSALLLAAAVIHRDASLGAYVLSQLLCVIATTNVVSYLKNRQSASNQRFENLLDGIHAYVLEADLLDGNVTFRNKQTVNRLGAIESLADLLTFVHPDDVDSVVRGIERGSASLTPVTLEVRIVVDDSVHHMEQRITFARVKGRVRVRHVFFDVSSRKRIELEMEHRAFHDVLTELPNRALFLDRLEHALMRAERTNSRHAVLLLDLDNFKDVNDGMGHHVGDALLIEVGQRLGRVIRRTDTLARLGGDEFAVLLEDTTPEAAVRVARQLVQAVAEVYPHHDLQLFPRVSAGISTYPTTGSTAAELLRQADVAMYHAKRGRLGVCLFDESINPESAQKLELLADFRTALDSDLLEAYFQPLVDASTGRLSSCEALVRWNHPTLGLLTPIAFLSTISAGGMSSDLARWMLAKVLDQLCEWAETDIAIPIAVNLSAVDIADRQLMEWLLGEIRDRSIPANLLSIELTEAELLDRSEQTIETLQLLLDAGVTTAVDDFGTGYSSLVWLRDLPIHTLKIDRSFVESMFADERSQTIVRSTIDMAQALHLSIVGEGVEDERTAVALRELGCNDLQGYHFSRPVTAQAMTKMLAARGERSSSVAAAARV